VLAPFDAVIAGARCAGATLAIHLARAGKRVLAIDSGALPSDQPLSTHFIPSYGMALLDELGGHSGIIMRAAPTRGGREVPVVVQLPGPSTQVSDGTYDPAATNDVTVGPWSRWRIENVPQQHQYLGRLLHSRFR
jgi:hypothetical protein